MAGPQVDLKMVMCKKCGGRQRTYAEYKTHCFRCGFTIDVQKCITNLPVGSNRIKVFH